MYTNQVRIKQLIQQKVVIFDEMSYAYCMTIFYQMDQVPYPKHTLLLPILFIVLYTIVLPCTFYYCINQFILLLSSYHCNFTLYIILYYTNIIYTFIIIRYLILYRYVLIIIYLNIYCHLFFYHSHSCIILLRFKAIG